MTPPDASLGGDPGPCRIVICNAYGDDNRGSAALNLASIEFAKLVCPGADVTLLALSDGEGTYRRAFRHTLAAYPEVSVVGTPIDLSVGPRFPGADSLRVARSLLTGRRLRSGAGEQAVRRADMVIGRGGVVFYQRRLAGQAGLVRSAYPLLLAHRLGIPTGLLAAHVGPFHGLSLLTARWLFRAVDVVSVRDATSAAWARSAGVRDGRVVEVPDSVFLLEGAKDAEKDLLARWGLVPGRFAAVTVSHEAYVNRSFRDLLAGMRSELKKLVAQRVIDDVAVVVQVDGGSVSDRPASMALSSEIGDVATLVDADLSPSSLIRLYSQARFVTGTRLHSTILGLVGGTPSFPIDLGSDLGLPKAKGVFAALGLEDWVVEFPTTSGLSSLVAEVLTSEQATRRHIKDVVERSREGLQAVGQQFLAIAQRHRGQNESG